MFPLSDFSLGSCCWPLEGWDDPRETCGLTWCGVRPAVLWDYHGHREQPCQVGKGYSGFWNPVPVPAPPQSHSGSVHQECFVQADGNLGLSCAAVEWHHPGLSLLTLMLSCHGCSLCASHTSCLSGPAWALGSFSFPPSPAFAVAPVGVRALAGLTLGSQGNESVAVWMELELGSGCRGCCSAELHRYLSMEILMKSLESTGSCTLPLGKAPGSCCTRVRRE